MKKYFVIPSFMMIFLTAFILVSSTTGYYVSFFFTFDQTYYLSLVPISLIPLIVFMSMKRIENKNKFDILFRVISLLSIMLLSVLIILEPKFYMQFGLGLQATILIVLWSLMTLNASYWIFFRKIIIKKLSKRNE